MKLACERVGSGEPLVLVHGVGHRRQAWYPVLDQLAEQREVVLVDLPGHGESDPLVTDGRPPFAVLQDALREFFIQQELDRPHVAGNSLGGRMALEAGVAGDARSVTALAPAGFWPSARSYAYSRTLFAVVGRVSQLLAPQAERLAGTRPGRVLGYGWMAAHPTRIDPEQAFGDFLAFRAAQPALRVIVASATRFAGTVPGDVPVTIVWGTRDAVLPRSHAKLARAVLPSADHVLLRSCGHVPMTDAPERVAGIILRGSSERRAPSAPADGHGGFCAN